MSASDSKSSNDDNLRKEGKYGNTSLSSLRAQFTSTPSPSLDQTMMQSARFREEERIRAGLRRESKLRKEALVERIAVMQENMATDIARQHEMSLGAFERDLRTQMESEISQLESETLTREEIRIREMHESVLKEK